MKNISSKICPICALTVIAWSLGLIALYLKISWINPLVVALLMGGSVGALAERFGKKYGRVWKTVNVIAGFTVVYALVYQKYLMAIVSLAIIVGVTILSKNKNTAVIQQDDLFKECC